MSANKLIGDSLDRLEAGAATAGRMLGEMWDETLDVLAEMVHRKFLSEIAGKQFHDRRAEVATHPTGKTRWVKKRQADREPLDAIVLHAMGFDRGNSVHSYDGVKAHFAVLRSGDILYLHHVSEYLNASHDFNRNSVAVEHAGNPPSERGKVANPSKGEHIPTIQQIEAGRRLVRALKVAYGPRHIYGHKQSCGGKVCPGPHLWYNIGRWAVRYLGMSDGGAGFSVGNAFCTGRALPEAWDDPRFDLLRPNGPDHTYQEGPRHAPGP